MSTGEDRSDWPEMIVTFTPTGVVDEVTRAQLHRVLTAPDDQVPGFDLTCESGAA